MTVDQPEQEDGAVALPVLWRGLDDQPLLYANQFVVQHQGDELIVTVGQLQPPILLGQPHERMEQARRLSFVPINAVARYAFTRQRFGELIAVLSEHLQKFDAERESQR